MSSPCGSVAHGLADFHLVIIRHRRGYTSSPDNVRPLDGRHRDAPGGPQPSLSPLGDVVHALSLRAASRYPFRSWSGWQLGSCGCPSQVNTAVAGWKYGISSGQRAAGGRRGAGKVALRALLPTQIEKPEGTSLWRDGVEGYLGHVPFSRSQACIQGIGNIGARTSKDDSFKPLAQEPRGQ